MKDRILEYLAKYARGESDELSVELKQELKQDDMTFQQNCTELLSEILHHYELFSISTIDAFFQRVIRSFTRESSLLGDYRLEVDQDVVLEDVINDLIDELGENQDLTQWVVEFATANLEEDKSWDVRISLRNFANEIFKDEFRQIENQVRSHSEDPDFFRTVRKELLKEKKNFLDAIAEPASVILETMASNGWSSSHIKYGDGSGLFTFLNSLGAKNISDIREAGKRVKEDFTIAKNWPGPKNLQPARMIEVAERIMVPNLKKILSLYEGQRVRALSAEVVLKNMYVFGLLSDISRKLQDYKVENNLMLLADAPQLLNKIIQDSDTPFIYEKVGSFYRNYLIDEFQDTSRLQWKNFQPLLINGLDQGYLSLVVGDVKQAIYRWRGGDLRLLQQDVEAIIGKSRVEVEELVTNFRSAQKIIDFNNLFFRSVSSAVSALVQSELPAKVYEDVSQKLWRKGKGFVQINFFEAQEDRSERDQAMEMIPRIMEKMQRIGVKLRDIAILVRTNGEGQDIAASLLHYRSSGQAQPDCNYEVVSNESLRMDGAATVNLLLAAMRHLSNTDDAVAKAQLAFEYSRLHHPDRKNADVFSVNDIAHFERNLPEKFIQERMSLKKLPLFELTETLIEIFELGGEKGELPYLLAFQDLVLEFYTREQNDMSSFLEWWELNRDKEKTSIKISGEVDAVRILTIHKAKGLQFKYVIIPFCSWGVDHWKGMAPNMWVRSDEPPFNTMGYFPVEYGSILDSTLFKEDYQAEKSAAFLDNLNLLYVALTRAEDGMVIFAPDARKDRVSSWLKNALLAEDLKSGWNEGSGQFMWGEWPSDIEKETNEKSGTLSLNRYYSSRWRDTLVIRQSGTEFFKEAVDEKRNKINYGVHLHSILSKIKYRGDAGSAIETLVLEGQISRDEKPAVEEHIEKLLNHPVVDGWFSNNWTVRTEAPILLPGGLFSRIDRLIIKDDEAIIIDFKTGEKTKADQKQVMEYIDILKKMNFTKVSGYLLYTKDTEIVSLPEKEKARPEKKKKNDGQLDLGLE